MNFIQSILAGKKKFIALLILMAVFVSPKTAYAQEQTELYFATTNGTRIDATRPINLPQGKNDLRLYLNTKNSFINGFQITISLPNAKIFELVENADADKFNLFFSNKTDTNKKTIVFSKFLTDTTQPPISGLLNLALITFTPSESGVIGIQKATITSPKSDTPLTVAKPQLSYIIQTPTPTPTLLNIPTSEPTLIPILPSPTPTSTPPLTLTPFRQCVQDCQDFGGNNINCNASCTPTSKSLEATPTIFLTATPTLYPETPTSTPPLQKTVVSITIDEKEVDINNPLVNLILPGREGEAGKFVIHIVIGYSDKSSKSIDIVFDYKPPTPIPTFIPSYTSCASQCEGFFDTDKSKQRTACLQVCDSLLPPTPTPTPVGCNCNLDEKEWISYGRCGSLGCAANEIPQYRTCDINLSCSVLTRCFPDARCPTPPTPTPTIIPGSCRSYESNVIDCVDHNCKWTGSLCVDK